MRVLIVDDSPHFREAVARVLAGVPGVEVVGEAADGDHALKLALSLEPDLVTLDLEMPRMDGFTFLRLVMAKRPLAVLVMSSHHAKEHVFRVLELGALDFLAKPSGLGGDLWAEALRSKVEMVRRLAPATFSVRLAERLREARAPRSVDPARPRAQSFASASPRHVVLVGGSSGGALGVLSLLKALPPDGAVAVVVAQHMPQNFTRGFAERLGRVATIPFLEAWGAQHLRRGQGYVCPGDRCIEVVPRDGVPAVQTVDPELGDRYVPSIDRLFESGAKVLGRRAVAVVLSGMGDDGARGAMAIAAAGGTVLVEDPATALVPGMPEAATRAGVADAILPVPALAARLAEHVR